MEFAAPFSLDRITEVKLRSGSLCALCSVEDRWLSSRAIPSAVPRRRHGAGARALRVSDAMNTRSEMAERIRLKDLVIVVRNAPLILGLCLAIFAARRKDVSLEIDE